MDVWRVRPALYAAVLAVFLVHPPLRLLSHSRPKTRTNHATHVTRSIQLRQVGNCGGCTLTKLISANQLHPDTVCAEYWGRNVERGRRPRRFRNSQSNLHAYVPSELFSDGAKPGFKQSGCVNASGASTSYRSLQETLRLRCSPTLIQRTQTTDATGCLNTYFSTATLTCSGLAPGLAIILTATRSGARPRPCAWVAVSRSATAALSGNTRSSGAMSLQCWSM